MTLNGKGLCAKKSDMQLYAHCVGEGGGRLNCEPGYIIHVIMTS